MFLGKPKDSVLGRLGFTEQGRLGESPPTLKNPITSVLSLKRANVGRISPGQNPISHW